MVPSLTVARTSAPQESTSLRLTATPLHLPPVWPLRGNLPLTSSSQKRAFLPRRLGRPEAEGTVEPCVPGLGPKQALSQ